MLSIQTNSYSQKRERHHIILATHLFPFYTFFVVDVMYITLIHSTAFMFISFAYCHTNILTRHSAQEVEKSLLTNMSTERICRLHSMNTFYTSFCSLYLWHIKNESIWLYTCVYGLSSEEQKFSPFEASLLME